MYTLLPQTYPATAPQLLLQTSTGAELINYSQLVRVEAISNYSKLYFSNGKTLVVAKVLAWFEARLAEQGFLRLHRSHLVNRAFIVRFVQQRQQVAILYNQEMVAVAKRKKHAVRSALCRTAA